MMAIKVGGRIITEVMDKKRNGKVMKLSSTRHKRKEWKAREEIGVN